MTDGNMLVTFGAVAEAAGDADLVAGQIEAQLSDLRGYLAPLVSSWSGQAASDHQALQARWDASAGDLNAVLREMARALRMAGENYQSTESANSSIFS